MEDNVKPEESVANNQKCFRQKRTLLERYLIAICVILFAVFIAMVIITFSLKSFYKYSKVECTSPACYREAGRILNYMDTSVDPCENFYNFACGSFLKYDRLSSAAVNTFTNAKDYLLRYSKEVLEEIDVNFEPEFIKKLKIFYESCLNQPTSASVIIEELLNKTKLNPWPILEEHGELATLSLEELLVIINSFIPTGNTPYFQINFGEVRRLAILPANYKINEEKLFNATDEDSLRKRRGYERLMAYALVNSNVPLVEIPSLIEEMMEFYEDLVNGVPRGDIMKIMLKYEGNERPPPPPPCRGCAAGGPPPDMPQLQQEMTLEELDSTCPEVINWRNYLKLLCDSFGYSHIFSEVFEIKKIGHVPPNIVKDLCKFLKDKDRRIVHNFTVWMLLLDKLVILDAYFRNLYNEVFPEIRILESPQYRKQYRMKWRSCMNVIGNGIFQPGLDYLMIQHMKAEESIKEVETYFENMKKAMERLFSEQDWLDEYSKTALKKTLREIRYLVGYTNASNDVDLVTEYFSPVKVTDNYVENQLLIGKITFEKYFFNISLMNLESYVLLEPMNVFGSKLSSSIEIPVASLVPPFISPGVPKYLNYGVIGFVVAHELGHVFDSIDKDKELPDTTVETFKKKKQCIIDQYSQYPLGNDGNMIDGVQTIRDNIADNSGLIQIVAGYDDYVKINGEEPYLTGLDYTNSQMLLIRYAQLWCELLDSPYEKYKKDIHSPGRYRAIGTLVNFPRFAKEFNCPIGSSMNPRKKCRVWG